MRIILTLLFILFVVTVLYAEKFGSVSVLVIDNHTENPVTDCSVKLGDKGIEQTTDRNGICFFNSVKPGFYSITVTVPEYETFNEPAVHIHVGNNSRFIAALKKQTAIKELDKMYVVGQSIDQKKLEQTTSVTTISRFELSNTPGTANDIERVVATNPAVVTGNTSDFDNTVYVRGGNSYENVYIFDGIEMESGSHFSSVNSSGGKVGFMNGALVQDLQFYTGAFPASLPSRISSVIDVTLRNGPLTETNFGAELNITGLGIILEGPMSKKISYIASIRYANLIFLKDMLTRAGVPRFGDGVVKWVYTPDNRNLFRFTSICAIDNYRENDDKSKNSLETYYDQSDYKGGAIGAWEYNNDIFKNEVNISGSFQDLRSNNKIDKFKDTVNLYMNTQNLSHYRRTGFVVDSLVFPTDTLITGRTSYVNETMWGNRDRKSRLSVQDKFTLYLHENNLLNLGFSANNYKYYVQSESGFYNIQMRYYIQDSLPVVLWQNSVASLPFNIDTLINVRNISGYAEYVFSKGLFKAIAGIRGDYFTVLTDYGISPRIGAVVNFSNSGSFSLSGGLYYQFPTEFGKLIEDVITSNPDENIVNNVPLDKARLQRCWQGAVGYEKRFSGDHLLNVETYFKWYDREYEFIIPGKRRYYEYKDDESISLLDKPAGKKKAYGVEISFQKKKYSHLYYSLSGALFNVENKYRNGKWYNDENNARCNLGLSIGYNAYHNGIALRLAITGGRPYTQAVYDQENNRNIFDSTFFSAFFDPFININIRYTFKLYPKWGNITGFIDLWNVLNQTPVIQRGYWKWSGFWDVRSNGTLPVAGITADF